MSVITRIAPTLCAPECGSPSRVLDDLSSAHRAHGQMSPLRGLADPRLAYPDLLMTSGWERIDLRGGFEYHFFADENTSSGDRWEQFYRRTADGTQLISRAGHKVQTINQSPDGVVTSQVTFED